MFHTFEVQFVPKYFVLLLFLLETVGVTAKKKKGESFIRKHFFF